jgi:quercetin dioxygenase-like cupin family protein
MNTIDLAELTQRLPEAWSSALLAEVGGAGLKVLRMDGRALEPERHEEPEALLVLEGRLELELSGESLSLGTGELAVVPAGALHAVRPGSHGTLLIVEVPERVD